MRIREGEYAYDIEPIKDTATMLFKHFRVIVERVRMEGDQKIYEGTAKTFEEAKELAEKKVSEFSSQAEAKRAS